MSVLRYHPLGNIHLVSARLTVDTVCTIDQYPSKKSVSHLDASSLKSTWVHRTWVATGCSSVAISLAKSAMEASAANVWIAPAVAGLLGYVLADLGTGIYHWGIDNYGDSSTLFFGKQIEAFQGHHKWPWTITKREFSNNLHVLARVLTLLLLPLNFTIEDPTLLSFIGVCSGCIMFSQQFHSWAHGTKSRLPPVVAALQDSGVLVSRSMHLAHHKAPYNNNYCIVSGLWNEVLDELRFFEAMEMAIFFSFRVRPRSWSEPNLDWLEETDTQEP